MKISTSIGILCCSLFLTNPTQAGTGNFLSSYELSKPDNSSLLKEFRQLRKQLPIRQTHVHPSHVNNAIFKAKNLNLKRTDKYVVENTLMDITEVSNAERKELAVYVQNLSYGADNGSPIAREELNMILDYLSSQDLYAKMKKFKYSDYAGIRTIPHCFMQALWVVNDARKTEIIRGMQTLLEWDKATADDATIQEWVSSDYLYNVIPYMYECALMNPDEEQGLKDLRAFSHFLDVCTRYNVGGKDLLKPDGTSFHHRTHYIGYMYSFRTWIDYLHKLSGTSFRISEAGYKRLRKAVISEYLTATRSQDDAHRIMANSMAGRHPFYGTKLTMDADCFKKLIEVGGDILQTGIDKELAAYYNAFYQCNEYAGIEPANLEGYYQFNYSPAGVYRKNNWVAVMRCPTTKFWGGEIYNKTNRFGRYQSHGTLEILYEGGLKATGYPANKKTRSAGWDWNMMPGSTTVHYTGWKKLMPSQNNKDRFDQWSKTTNFAGALAGDQCGLFAADFDQNDVWGQPRYEATNLTFRKSVFAIDGMLFSVGNQIAAEGNYPQWTTATTLFQSLINEASGDLTVNGKVLEKGSEQQFATDQAVILVAPTTTGFYLPKGHDTLTVCYKKQSSFGSAGIKEGEKPTSVLAAKAYLNHGVKPHGKSYQYLTVPATTSQSMQEIAKQFEAGQLFQVVAMQPNLHIIRHVPSGTLAYTFFGRQKGLQAGKILASGTELLVLEKSQGNTLQLAVCNPNLRPQDLNKKDWKSAPTSAALLVKGSWKLSQSHPNVLLQPKADGNTLIRIHLFDGEKVDLRLQAQ